MRCHSGLKLTLTRVNVGGGFAVWRDRQAPDLERVFTQISDCAKAIVWRQITGPCLRARTGHGGLCLYAGHPDQGLARPADRVFERWRIYGLLSEFRDLGVSQRYQAFGVPAANWPALRPPTRRLARLATVSISCRRRSICRNRCKRAIICCFPK